MAIGGFWTRAKIIWAIVIGVFVVGLGAFGYLYFTGNLKFLADVLITGKWYSLRVSSPALADGKQVVIVESYVTKGDKYIGKTVTLAQTTGTCDWKGANAVTGMGKTTVDQDGRAQWVLTSKKPCDINYIQILYSAPNQPSYRASVDKKRTVPLISFVAQVSGVPIDWSKSEFEHQRTWMPNGKYCTDINLHMVDKNGVALNGVVALAEFAITKDYLNWHPYGCADARTTYDYGMGKTSSYDGVVTFSVENLDSLPSDHVLTFSFAFPKKGVSNLVADANIAYDYGTAEKPVVSQPVSNPARTKTAQDGILSRKGLKNGFSATRGQVSDVTAPSGSSSAGVDVCEGQSVTESASGDSPSVQVQDAYGNTLDTRSSSQPNMTTSNGFTAQAGQDRRVVKKASTPLHIQTTVTGSDAKVTAQPVDTTSTIKTIKPYHVVRSSECQGGKPRVKTTDKPSPDTLGTSLSASNDPATTAGNKNHAASYEIGPPSEEPNPATVVAAPYSTVTDFNPTGVILTQ